MGGGRGPRFREPILIFGEDLVLGAVNNAGQLFIHEYQRLYRGSQPEERFYIF
jgi:hypothetical protein